MHRLDDPPPMTPETEDEKAARRALLLKAAAALPPRNLHLDAEESEVYRAAKTDEERTMALQIIMGVRAKKAREALAQHQAPNAKQVALNRKVRRRESRLARRKNRR